MAHLNEDTLEQYLMTGAEDPVIEEHLLACPRCAENAQGMAEYLEAVTVASRISRCLS